MGYCKHSIGIANLCFLIFVLCSCTWEHDLVKYSGPICPPPCAEGTDCAKLSMHIEADPNIDTHYSDEFSRCEEGYYCVNKVDEEGTIVASKFVCSEQCPEGMVEFCGVCIKKSLDMHFNGDAYTIEDGHYKPKCAYLREDIEQGNLSKYCSNRYGDCNKDWTDGCEVHLATDKANCGACNTPCDSGVCDGMMCMSFCPENLVLCDVKGVRTCIDPNTNRDFCGASHDCDPPYSGKHCAMGWQCINGECTLECQEPLLQCDTGVGLHCIDQNNDRLHCGGCGKMCAENEACYGGKCRSFCALKNLCPVPNAKDGEKFCADLANDPKNCSACGYDCAVILKNSLRSRCSGICSALSCQATHTLYQGGCFQACTDAKKCILGENWLSAKCLNSACIAAACTEGYTGARCRKSCVSSEDCKSNGVSTSFCSSGKECYATSCEPGYHLENYKCFLGTGLTKASMEPKPASE